MSSQAQRAKSLFRVLISLLILLGAVLVFQNRQLIQDQLVASRYQPSAEMVAVINRIAPTDKGLFLVRASQAQLLARDDFNHACRSVASEQTAVLGCYANNRIYLFDIDDEKLDGIKEVTTAHEMLHAAYQRLSVSERERIDGLLEKQSFGADETRINELLAQYAESEPGERMNELHSILGSELRVLDPELEAYYSQYFKDRSQLVALSAQYQSVFTELKNRQDELVRNLNRLADAVERASSVYKRDQQVLANDINDFNRMAGSGQMSREQYERERLSLESRQAALRSEYSRIQSLIAEYEDSRNALASINSESNALNRSINSSLAPVPEVN